MCTCPSTPAEILEDLGVTSAPFIASLVADADPFYAAVSQEDLDKIDAQVVCTYVDSDAISEANVTSAPSTTARISAQVCTPIGKGTTLAAMTPRNAGAAEHVREDAASAGESKRGHKTS